MKLKWLTFVILLVAVAMRLPAQTSDSNSLESTKAKAEGGDAVAQFNLGLMYQKGRGVTQDNAEAVKWYRMAAEQGLANAQCNLGFIYLQGDGVQIDLMEAAKWFRKAAEQGNANAQNSLGVLYEHGQGVTKDDAEALKWYQKAAEKGDSVAQFNLGAMYFHGEGTMRNYAEAMKWYRKSAEQGNPHAQGLVGICYEEGKGVTSNIVEAVKWYRRAAEQGSVRDECSLGFCYLLGQGVTKNYADSVKWFRKAAEQGDDMGQEQLGERYYFGDGVPKDYVEAYKWFNLAAAQGETNAANFRLWISEKMTPEQIAAAQELTRTFKSHKAPSSESSQSPGTPAVSGTGFFITDDGYLISNYHVIKDTKKVRVLTGAGLIDATVVKVDSANDLALLKAGGQFAPLPIATSRTVKLGGTVATVGFPDIGLQGFAPKLAKGEIASLSGAADDPRYFQISLPVQPGNSGGALVDTRGNVVGIVAAKLDASVALAASGALPENVNYAVKSSLLLSFLESMPDVSAKLKEPNTKEEPFEDVVKSAQDAAVLVLVY